MLCVSKKPRVSYSQLVTIDSTPEPRMSHCFEEVIKSMDVGERVLKLHLNVLGWLQCARHISHSESNGVGEESYLNIPLDTNSPPGGTRVPSKFNGLVI